MNVRMTQELEDIRNGPPQHLTISIPPTRYVAEKYAPPSAPPPYSSVFDDVFTQNTILTYTGENRQTALFPVRLRAGQHQPPNGELGRHATPEDVPSMLGAPLGSRPVEWALPEGRGGTLVAVSI